MGCSKTKVETYTGPGAPKTLPAGVLIGFGNPLLDIVADVPKEFLQKYDVQPKNAILAEESHLPIYKDLIDNYKVDYVAGGATQNVIRAAQWIIQSPSATSFFGAIGKDSAGTTLKKACESSGVTTYYYESEDKPTGTCASLVLNNERSMVTNLAACETFKFSHVQTPALTTALENSQIIYVGGFPITLPEGPETIDHLCKLAVTQRKVFCLNLAAPFIIDFFTTQLLKIIPYSDYIFCNESEASSLIKKLSWGCSLEEAAVKLSEFPKESGRQGRVVVFTQGKEPTIVAKEGSVVKYEVPVLEQSLVVDTTGAGDSFVGGFLGRLSQGCDIAECVRTGHYAARVVIQQSGVVFPNTPAI